MFHSDLNTPAKVITCVWKVEMTKLMIKFQFSIHLQSPLKYLMDCRIMIHILKILRFDDDILNQFCIS